MSAAPAPSTPASRVATRELMGTTTVVTVRAPTARMRRGVRRTPAPLPAPLPLPGELTWGRWHVVCAPAVYGGQPQGPWDFWLDRASVPSLTLRPRQTGDRLVLAGRPEKSLKKWMIQEKVPRHLRGLLPVFACGGQIAAAGGLGPDRAFCPKRGAGAWHITLSPAPQAEQTGKE